MVAVQSDGLFTTSYERCDENCALCGEAKTVIRRGRQQP
jgi:hypothetical protein